jgi:hypothetical protein
VSLPAVRRALWVAIVAALVAGPTAAQDASSTEAADRPLVEDAAPYEASEFPGWALAVRRGEIVALGSLPISLLASRLVYGLGRFTVQSIATRSFAVAYLPALFAPPDAVPLAREDNVRIVVGALFISGVVAVIDHALGRAALRAEDARRAEADE